jgi:hypothetical protein
MPSPVFALKGRKTDPGVTNVRNAALAPVARRRKPLRRPLQQLFGKRGPAGRITAASMVMPVISDAAGRNRG